MGWHVFRNAHASLLDEHGFGLRDVAARLGHGHDYAVTMSYGLKAEAARPSELLPLVTRHAAPPSPETPRPDELAARRARRHGTP
jgi:hypothetical protein